MKSLAVGSDGSVMVGGGEELEVDGASKPVVVMLDALSGDEVERQYVGPTEADGSVKGIAVADDGARYLAVELAPYQHEDENCCSVPVLLQKQDASGQEVWSYESEGGAGQLALSARGDLFADLGFSTWFEFDSSDEYMGWAARLTRFDATGVPVQTSRPEGVHGTPFAISPRGYVLTAGGDGDSGWYCNAFIRIARELDVPL